VPWLAPSEQLAPGTKKKSRVPIAGYIRGPKTATFISEGISFDD